MKPDLASVLVGYLLIRYLLIGMSIQAGITAILIYTDMIKATPEGQLMTALVLAILSLVLRIVR